MTDPNDTTPPRPLTTFTKPAPKPAPEVAPAPAAAGHEPATPAPAPVPLADALPPPLPPREVPAGLIRVRAVVPQRATFHGLWTVGQFWPSGTYLVDLTPEALERIRLELDGVPGNPVEWLQLVRLDTGETYSAKPLELDLLRKQAEEEREVLARGLAIKARKEAEAKEASERAKIAAAEEASRNAVVAENAQAQERRRMDLEEARRLVAEEDARLEAGRQATKDRQADQGVSFINP